MQQIEFEYGLNLICSSDKMTIRLQKMFMDHFNEVLWCF